MSNGAYPGHTPAFRRHGFYVSPNSCGPNQPTLAPAYGRTINQLQFNPFYPNSIGHYPYPAPQISPVMYTPPVTPAVYSPQVAPGVYTSQMAPSLYPTAMVQTPELRGITVSPRGFETILIAILILAALDLILVRPHKYSLSTP